MFNTNDPGSSLRDVTVLSVDDDPFFRRLVERLLEKVGVGKVIAAGDAAQALDFLLNSPGQADLVLLDLDMPGMNGVAFLQGLRGSPDSRVADLPVIILTDHGSAGVVKGMVRFGIHGFLVKPPGPEELGETLRRALSGVALSEDAIEAYASSAPGSDIGSCALRAYASSASAGRSSRVYASPIARHSSLRFR